MFSTCCNVKDRRRLTRDTSFFDAGQHTLKSRVNEVCSKRDCGGGTVNNTAEDKKVVEVGRASGTAIFEILATVGQSRRRLS